MQAFHIMTHAIVMYREEQKNFSTLFYISFNPFFPFIDGWNPLLTFTARITTQTLKTFSTFPPALISKIVMRDRGLS